MIEPFFFDNAKLFGCYHAAEDWSAQRLLIICPPLFDEYRRCYRALSDLASACAQQNVHVIRFDYFGTGESPGELESATLSEWLQGIDSVIEEGLAISGASEVVLSGVRFGATLAAQSNNSQVSRRIFWDPVESGQYYLRWLDQVNDYIVSEHREMARAANLRFEKRDFENFSLTPRLRDELTALVFNRDEFLDLEGNFIVSTDRHEAGRLNHAKFQFANFDYDWPEYHDGILTPKPVLESIAQKVLLP